MNPTAPTAATRWSLHSLLVGLAVFVTLFAWIAGGALAWRLAEQRIQELHDSELRHMAQLLMGLSSHEVIEIGGDTLPIEARVANAQSDTQDTLGSNYRYQLWSASGQLQLSNVGLVRKPGGALAPMHSPGYHWVELDGEPWRVFVHRDDSTGQELHMAERGALRQGLAGSIDAQVVGWVLLSMVLVLLPALWLLRRLLRPLHRLAGELESRSPANLGGLEVPGAPRELSPVVGAMNRLFQRVADAMQRERSFTATAAHELRTPLAALRLQAQVAADTDDEQVRARNLRELVRSADRCARLQDQLLTLARLDAAQAGELDEHVEMTDVLMDAVAEVATEARRRDVRLQMHSDGVALRGHAFGLRTLIRNLVSNAVRHTPEGGRIEIRVGAHDGGVRGGDVRGGDVRGGDVLLRVDDSGPGIPAALRAKAFERFERLKATKADGVGLGLSIVQAVAQAHGATVELGDSPLGGLAVVVRFAGRGIAGSADAAGLRSEHAAGDVAHPAAAMPGT